MGEGWIRWYYFLDFLKCFEKISVKNFCEKIFVKNFCEKISVKKFLEKISQKNFKMIEFGFLEKNFWMKKKNFLEKFLQKISKCVILDFFKKILVNLPGLVHLVMIRFACKPDHHRMH